MSVTITYLALKTSQQTSVMNETHCNGMYIKTHLKSRNTWQCIKRHNTCQTYCYSVLSSCFTDTQTFTHDSTEHSHKTRNINKLITAVDSGQRRWSFNRCIQPFKVQKQLKCHTKQQIWYTGHWWVGYYIWYSEEGRPLFAVPNVTAHPSTASVPITVLLYNGPLLCGFSVPIKGKELNHSLSKSTIHSYDCQCHHQSLKTTARLLYLKTDFSHYIWPPLSIF